MQNPIVPLSEQKPRPTTLSRHGCGPRYQAPTPSTTVAPPALPIAQPWRIRAPGVPEPRLSLNQAEGGRYGSRMAWMGKRVMSSVEDSCNGFNPLECESARV